MSARCPHCSIDLDEVRAEARLGYFLSLDQCRRCGGLWCDRWEAFPLTAEAAERLDRVDAVRLRAPLTPADEDLRCPRCVARMKAFQDDALPAEACIQRCLNCEGMWFNRGELRGFKRRTQRSHAPAVLDEATLDHLARAATAAKSPPLVNNIDSALHPTKAPHESATAAEVQGEIAGAAVWLVARLLLRLLLGL
jgi:Zn-finger nucleic acid-binding protein